MQVSANVRAVQVPDGNPMHPQFTTIYLVGRGQVLTIDSGEDDERYRWMLKGYLAASEKAEIGLSAVSHFHADHSANLRWLRDQFGAEVLAMREGGPLLGDRLPDQGVRFLGDGDVIGPSDSLKLQVMHTPGHSPDSTSFYLEDEGVLFSGDTILGGSTTTVVDLSDYLQSLSRLRALPNLKQICPGHGPVIDNPAGWIDEYVAHRSQREQQILEVLSDGEAHTSWSIMARLYADLNPRLRRAADGNVRSHLAKLEKDGRVKVYAGKPRAVSADAAAVEAAEEHERQETLRRADEIREQSRRRAIYLQENPPEGEWVEPPRYELF
jgi:ribonuclease/clavin/mitogillin